MNLRKSILVIIFGFFIGVFANSFLNLDYYFGLFLALFGLIFLHLTFPRYLISCGKVKGLLAHLLEIGNKKFYIIISMLLIGASFGVLRYEVKDSRNAALDNFTNQKISFEGIITEEPQEKENYTQTIVKIEDIRCPKDIGCPKNQKILIYSRPYPEFNYGDKIKITGELKKPQKFSVNSAGGEIETKQFDWPSYLAKDNIYHQMFYPKIEFVSAHNGSFIKQKLFALKNRFTENLEKTIPSPASSFMAGITIGEKSALSKTLKDDLIKTGTIHLIVLSGYNITIVAATVMNFLKIFPIPNFLGGTFGAAGVILFTIMTGAEAATVRAAIMALLIITANQTGRTYAAINALIFAAFFMVLANPAILRFDTSFQLSFLATLGLIYFSPKFEKLFWLAPKKLKIKENLTATVSAQTAVLPLLIYKTGIISLVSIPLNAIILTFMPITMFLGFLTGAVGFINYYLSYPFGLISFAFLDAELWLIKLSASLPFSYINF